MPKNKRLRHGVGAKISVHKKLLKCNKERCEILSVLNEDILSFRAQGFAVDNDNEPAPENIPTLNDSGADDIYQP
jgi:hypothetical protein